MIIGITGTMASGKDTAAEYLKEKGCAHYSLSDIVREECDARGLPKDRDTLRELANELRRDFGADILASRAIEKIQREKPKNIIITSIRSAEEIKTLKKIPGFELICIDAPVELRYERIKNRQRESDFIDFKTFKHQEELELAGGANKQNIKDAIALADYTIINDETLEELKEKIEKIISFTAI